jgi:hypothetical protein
MLLFFLLLINIFQILLYIVADEHKISRTWILMLLLLGIFFVLPPYFYPEMKPDGVRCGNALIGVTLACWIFGSFLCLLVHFCYYFYKNKPS